LSKQVSKILTSGIKKLEPPAAVPKQATSLGTCMRCWVGHQPVIPLPLPQSPRTHTRTHTWPMRAGRAGHHTDNAQHGGGRHPRRPHCYHGPGPPAVHWVQPALEAAVWGRISGVRTSTHTQTVHINTHIRSCIHVRLCMLSNVPCCGQPCCAGALPRR